jgi:hypothetical protein
LGPFGRSSEKVGAASSRDGKVAPERNLERDDHRVRDATVWPFEHTSSSIGSPSGSQQLPAASDLN